MWGNLSTVLWRKQNSFFLLSFLFSTISESQLIMVPFSFCNDAVDMGPEDLRSFEYKYISMYHQKNQTKKLTKESD